MIAGFDADKKENPPIVRRVDSRLTAAVQYITKNAQQKLGVFTFVRVYNSAFILPPAWAAELTRMANADAKEASEHVAESSKQLRAQLADIQSKLARLTDLFVEQDIEREEYLTRKRSLLSTKRSVEEQLLLVVKDAAYWLEPLQEWIQEASNIGQIAQSKDLPSKKSSLQHIFGSNLFLQARIACGEPLPHWFSVLRGTENPSTSDLVSAVVRRVGFEPT